MKINTTLSKILLLCSICIISTISYSQAPTITSFSPASGAVGTLVTIRGTNLNSTTALTIGGVAAILVSGSSDSIVGMVMPGATTSAVSMTTSGGSASGNTNFTITPTGYCR